MLVMGSASLRMKYFSVESLADMERCALVCTEIHRVPPFLPFDCR